MKIGIDISQVVYGTGVSFYIRNLVKNLLSLDRKNEYLLFAGSLRQTALLKEVKQDVGCKREKCYSKFLPFSPKIANILFNKIHFIPIELLVGNLDVFHSSDWVQPRSKAFKVTTIHDLSPIFLPKLTPKSIVKTHKLRLRRVFEEVDRIIVPSEFTKNELLRLGFSNGKIRVIYESAGEAFIPKSPKEVQKIKHKYKIRGKYILAVGIGERKNTQGLIKGYELARAGKELTLVIVGKPEESLETKRGVRYVETLDNDEDLAFLYSGAQALVYPSFYEGFGLPILQGFACNCPVVTSNLTSMSEIAGGAAILINPEDPSSISEGIKKALSAPKTYINKGKKRIKDFSWKRTAQQTLKVYQEYKL